MKKAVLMISTALIAILVCAGVVFADSPQCKAFLQIDNKVKFSWTARGGETVDIYGVERPDDTERISVATAVDASRGEYLFDFLAADVNYSDYYIFEFKKSGSTTETVMVATDFIAPRRGKEITNIQHPFLITNQEGVDKLKNLIATNEFYKKRFDSYITQCEGFVKNYADPENITVAKTGISSSVASLGTAWALTGDDRYLVAGRDALLHLTDYLYTNTSVTTEIKNDYWYIGEAAIGYDLLYNGLNEVDRQVIENGLLVKWCKRLMSVSRGRQANQGGVNWVAPAIGLLVRDQELIDIGIYREGYGLMFNLLNSTNDDGSRWNHPTMYYEGIWYYYRLAEMFWNSNYDLYNMNVSGARTPAYLDNSSNFREPQYGDTLHVTEKYPFHEMLNFYFYYIYSDRNIPKIGDTSTSGVYNLTYSGEARVMYELWLTRLNDPKAAWLIKDTFGAERNTGNFGAFYSMFFSEPEPGDVDFFIGSGYFNDKGYNKLGNSVFSDYGHVIFRSEGPMEESTNSTLYWKRYQEPHGHSDMLNLTLYGAGSMNIMDMGSYTYGSAVHSNYIQRTISHNTLLIDEVDHWPNEGTYGNEKVINGESTRGFLENIAIGPNTRAVKAWTDRVYSAERNGIDSELQRTVWQIDDYIIDVFKATGDGNTHTIDYPLNINGTLNSSSRTLTPEADPDTPLGTKNPGYNYVRKLSKSAVSGETWHNDYDITDGGKLRITMLGGDDMQVITAKAASRTYEYEDEKLIVRKTTDKDTSFISVMEPVHEGEGFRTVTQAPVKIRGNEVDWASGLQISDNKGTVDTFVYGESYGVKQVDSLYSDGETAFLRRVNGEDTILGGMGMKYVGGRTISLTFKSQSAAQFTKLSDDCYRLDMGEGTQKNSGVTISGLGDGYKVFKMELSDEVILNEISAEGLTFSVEPEGIYIISKNGAHLKMPAQTTISFDNVLIKTLDMSNTLVTKVIDAAPTGIIIEAEDNVAESGGKIVYGIYPADSRTTNNEKGSAFYMWDAVGHSLSWEVNLPKAGKYKIVIRYGTLADGGADRALRINDGLPYILHFDTTPGWSDRHVGLLMQNNGDDMLLDFKEGINTITMDNIGNALNLDHFTLVPVE